jgi:2-haloacid dehalogenase
MTDLDFGRFQVLTFDCYGTLIDWEIGLLAAMRPILERHGVEAGDDELLEATAGMSPGSSPGRTGATGRYWQSR